MCIKYVHQNSDAAIIKAVYRFTARLIKYEINEKHEIISRFVYFCFVLFTVDVLLHFFRILDKQLYKHFATFLLTKKFIHKPHQTVNKSTYNFSIKILHTQSPLQLTHSLQFLVFNGP